MGDKLARIFKTSRIARAKFDESVELPRAQWHSVKGIHISTCLHEPVDDELEVGGIYTAIRLGHGEV